MKNAFLPKRHKLSITYSIALLLAITAATLQGLTSNAQSTATAPTGLENFGKLNDNYYRGSQPSAEEFTGLKKLGVKTVIDLRKDSIEEAQEWARSAGLEYINIPLTTKRAATQEQTAYFLKLVADPARWPVYVHCKGGRHRTGQMSAIYRITHDGWTAEQAYEEMKKYDFEDSWFYPRSLKKYVFSYYKEFASQQTDIQADLKASPSVPK